MNAQVDRQALAAFDAFAIARGGRSALVRQLLDQTLREGGGAARIDPPAGRSNTHVALRFTEVEAAGIDYRAAQRTISRASWVTALVRRHLALKSRVDDGLLAELAPIRMQLLRIGRNLNQAMRAANAAMLPDGNMAVELHLQRLADMRMEISEQVTALGDAMRGDSSYWAVPE